MSITLLSTKLHIPRTRANGVSRPRLTEKLLNDLKRPGSFALLSGPAGFGKTTLLSEFVEQFGQPVAWVSLDEGDNDPIRFWTYLITACQSVQAEVGESALALFQTPQPLPDDTIPTILINDLVGLESDLILILDDYHVIQNPSIHAALAFLLDHLPDKLHLVLSTRVDPPWPLARFRARNQLIEIRAAGFALHHGRGSRISQSSHGVESFSRGCGRSRSAHRGLDRQLAIGRHLDERTQRCLWFYQSLHWQSCLCGRIPDRGSS